MIEQSYIFGCIEVWYTPSIFGQCASVQAVQGDSQTLAIARSLLSAAGVSFQDLDEQLLIDMSDFCRWSPAVVFALWFGGAE